MTTDKKFRNLHNNNMLAIKFRTPVYSMTTPLQLTRLRLFSLFKKGATSFDYFFCKNHPKFGKVKLHTWENLQMIT